MKKKTIIIIGSVLMVVLAVLLIVFRKDIFKEPEKIDENIVTVESQELLSLSKMSEIKKYAETEKIELYDEYGVYCFYGAETTVGKADVQIHTDEYDVNRIFFNIELFALPQNDSETDSAYEFTESDKKKIGENFEDVKGKFEKYIGCEELKNYSVVPVREPMEGEELPETEEDKFYQGFILKEYSVRDADGTLWILSHASANGYSWAEIIKVVEETGYEGFIPNIDMTK